MPATAPVHGRAPLSAGNPALRILPLVGNTPLLEIHFRVQGRPGCLFAKYEALNFTGSIKDRMAVWILGRAYEEGRIAPDDEIIEASSGNTALSLAGVGRALGHPVRIFMPDWMSTERKTLLAGFGAVLVEVSAAEGGFVGSIARAREHAAAHPHTFLPEQFTNPANVEAHEAGTGPEILTQLRRVGRAPDAFVAGVGTGGTVMGVCRAFRAAGLGVPVHPVEPAESPVLSTGRQVGRHRIQGISDEFVPDIVDLEALGRPLAVSDGDAILMAQRLARDLGLAVGISSGANVVAAIRLQQELGPHAAVATVLPDSSKKYLSTDLFREEPEGSGRITPGVRLEGWRALPALPRA